MRPPDGQGRRGRGRMRINLYTDAPKHNLALMKISAWHKANGDEVTLNMPIMSCDYSYASILFEKNKKMFNADEYGGIAFNDDVCLPNQIESIKPDYSLFNYRPVLAYRGNRKSIKYDYSIGYTFRPCFRKCLFCKVPKMKHPDTNHHSIWEFHNPNFSIIELLNNNTFFDPQWRETFHEIWDANLTLREHGFDLRLIDEEKVEYLKKTKIKGHIHYAWDRMEDESAILEGLKIAPHGGVYVLIGFNTTEEEDIYRCQKIVDHGHDPYIMPYHQNRTEKRFKRFIDSFMWRKYKTIQEAWENYR